MRHKDEKFSSGMLNNIIQIMINARIAASMWNKPGENDDKSWYVQPYLEWFSDWQRISCFHNKWILTSYYQFDSFSYNLNLYRKKGMGFFFWCWFLWHFWHMKTDNVLIGVERIAYIVKINFKATHSHRERKQFKLLLHTGF